MSTIRRSTSSEASVRSLGTSSEASLVSLYALRLAYLILGGGLCVFVWPTVISHPDQVVATSGIRLALLGGLGLIALLGLRYPLQMLPLLLFELTWKVVYLLAFALPLWAAHRMIGDVAGDVQQVLVAVVFLPLIPWRYVYLHYMRQRGDRWR